MPKTKTITVTTQDEATVTSSRNTTTIKVDEPDINELLVSIEDEDIVTYIRSENFKPEDVFNADELHAWAFENGYIKE